MKAETRRALIRLTAFLCLTMVFAIIYSTIIYGVEYFFGWYWAGLSVRVVTFVTLAVCLGYLMVKDENKGDKEEHT